MKNKLRTVVFAMLFCSCTAGNEEIKTQPDPAPAAKKQTVKPVPEKNRPDSVYAVCTETNLRSLVLVPIDEKEFEKQKPCTGLVFFTPETRADSFFIHTLNKGLGFKRQTQTAEAGTNGWEFLGYYTGLKCYAVAETSTSENLNFSDLYLIDSLTGYRYRLPGFNDGYGEMPLVTQDQKRMLYYANVMYKHKNSDMLILTTGNRNEPGRYLCVSHEYHSDDFCIEAVRWADNNRFVIKGYEEKYVNGSWMKKYVYYQGQAG